MSASNPKVPLKVAFSQKLFHESRDSHHAYVVVEEGQDVSKLLALNGQKFNGHILRIDRADNKEHDTERTVFVGGLPFGKQLKHHQY